MAQLRLDKLLADMGIAARKELKDIIKAGRVSVDGLVVNRPDTKLNPEASRVLLDGEELCYKRFSYLMMDKPCGVVTATEDKQQQTVLDLVTDEQRRMGLFPVGRLDKDTSGLLLLTNDGDFAHRVISPKSCVEKRYYARVEEETDVRDISAFEQGIILRDGTQCLPAKMQIIGKNECYVTLTEGKYHQVRRMLAACGKHVIELRRLSIGKLQLDENLGPGGFRALSEEALCSVFM